MRIFVVCTGRCGSVTFSKACSHITNYSVGHETNVSKLGAGRFAYPSNHIEVDNRLSWMMGPLIEKFGRDPHEVHYVHLKREKTATSASFAKRKHGLMAAWTNGVVMYGKEYSQSAYSLAALDMVDCINANITRCLIGVPHTVVQLEEIFEQWPNFWETIRAEGSLKASLAEWNVRYNSSGK